MPSAIQREWELDWGHPEASGQTLHTVGFKASAMGRGCGLRVLFAEAPTLSSPEPHLVLTGLFLPPLYGLGLNPLLFC